MGAYKLLFFFLIFFLSQTWVLGNNIEISRLQTLLSQPISDIEKAGVYARIGMFYTERSLDSSFHYGSMALDLSRKIMDRKNEARAMSVLAFCYMEQGNAYLAYKFANDALSLFKQLDLPEQVAEMTMNMGVLLLKEGKIGQGAEQIESAYLQSQKLENDSIQSLIILNMVMSKHHELPTFEIERYYQEADRIAKKYKDQRTQLLIKHARASMMFRKDGDPDSARSEQQEVLRETREKGYDYLTALILMELGNTYIRQDPDSAVFYVDAAIDLSEQLGYEVLYYNFLNHAAHSLRTIHPVPEVVSSYWERLDQFNRLRAVKDQRAGLGFMELAIREQDLEMQQAKLQIRQMWLVVIGVAGGLALLMVCWMLWQARVKRRLHHNLERTSEELAEKNLQLEENDRFNRRLISILSHDLRQPFSAILMMSDDLLADLTPQEQQIVYKDIRKSAAVSLQVMDGLLYWTKLQTVGLAETPTSVSVRRSFEKALTFYEYDIQKADLEIILEIDQELSVLCQREMLLFVNRNLISNAIKYSPPGGMITVQAEVDPVRRRVLVQISDMGPGIPDKKLKALFQKQKGASSEDMKLSKSGAGMALIICHEMIGQMDGRIWAENSSKGRGAIFYYELPPSDYCTTTDSQKAAEFQ